MNYTVRPSNMEHYGHMESADCPVCGSLWRRGPLSAPRPVCHVCDTGICGRCEQVRCAGCGARMHDKCAQVYAEDQWCPACAAREVEIDRRAVDVGLLAGLTLEEKLIASIAVATYRKHPDLLHDVLCGEGVA